MTHSNVVVVGAGQAALQLAASLRESGHAGRIVLVGDEPHLPYQRPPLSKGYLLGEVGAAQLCLRPEAFFTAQGIERIAGNRALAIDRAQRSLCLADGSALRYDELVLATGARNRPLSVPGADLQGVFCLRTLAEADALRAQLRADKRLVIVGAGFVGLELAALAVKLGLHVCVLDIAERPMARALSKTMSAVCAREHDKQGVRLSFETRVARLLGERGRVRAVETVDGQLLEADLVVVGIGVVPNGELAAACGLPVVDGVVVDEYLRTCDPRISAIGDVAAHPSSFARGRQVRLESVQNAVDQARCAASRLAGRPSPYRALPWFWSQQGALRLQMAGLPSSGCEEVVRGDPNSAACSVYSFRDGRLTSVESLNRAADHMLARRLLGGGVAVTQAQAADASFRLETLL